MLRQWIAGGMLASFASLAQAQEDCGRTYVLQEGDTLLSIAQDYYQDRSKWSVIYYENEDALGGNLVDLPSGATLNIPCVDGETYEGAGTTAVSDVQVVSEAEDAIEPDQTAVPLKADPTPLQQQDADIKLLTGSNYAPFTDQEWLGGGMFTELVNAAFEEAPSHLPFSITWENDWSKHLYPLLDDKTFDMGFPWARPNCEEDPTNERCSGFHFSEPVFDVLELLYVKADSDLTFFEDSDLHGKSICRPKGYFTHDLEENGRLWLTKDLITLVQPETPANCFEMLEAGEVDFAAASEFLGPSVTAKMGKQDAFKSLERALSSSGLHVIISKRHWRGTTNLYRFNAGLEQLKKTPRYQEIVDRHWKVFAESLK
jgi:polar amino acid transport system substrate-binding protein